MPPPTLASIPIIATAQGKTLPIEAYSISDQDEAIFDRAYDRAVSACMSRFGFNYVLPEPAMSTSPSSLAVGLASRYGNLDLAAASSRGYQVDPAFGHKRVGPALSGAAQLVLTGGQGPMDETALDSAPSAKKVSGVNQPVPDHGCSGESYRRVYAPNGSPTDADLVQSINGSSFDDSQADPRVKAALAAWSTCMTGFGFSYASPHDAEGNPSFADSTTASPTEIATAVADVKCHDSTNLFGIWFTVETAYEDVLIQRHVQALNAIKQGLNDSLQRASAIQ